MQYSQDKWVSVTTARPQVADGGMASNTEGNCEYIEKAAADSRQGAVLQFRGWVGCKKLLTVKRITLQNIIWCLILGL